MENIEEWKDIPGFEGIYQASTFGNIRSIKFNKLKELKYYSNKGYNSIGLYKNKTRRKYLIHRLIAATFIDNNLLDSNLTINHKDGVRNNNKLNNLEICTIAENQEDIIKRKHEFLLNNADVNSDLVVFSEFFNK